MSIQQQVEFENLKLKVLEQEARIRVLEKRLDEIESRKLRLKHGKNDA